MMLSLYQQRILGLLVDQPLTKAEIARQLDAVGSGYLAAMVDELEEEGFLRSTAVKLTSGRPAKVYELVTVASPEGRP